MSDDFNIHFLSFLNVVKFKSEMMIYRCPCCRDEIPFNGDQKNEYVRIVIHHLQLKH